jgi:hypothetical protein
MAISIEYEHFASQNFATSKMAILSEFDWISGYGDAYRQR